MEAENQSEEESLSTAIKVGAVAGIIGIIVVVFVVVNFLFTKPQPAPEATLGAATEPAVETTPIPTSTPFIAPADDPWIEYAGVVYPYSFSAPSTLPITNFPSDPTDSWGIPWDGQPAQRTIFLSVGDLNDSADTAAYIGRPMQEFVENWWTFFGGLTGVESVDQFTNEQGLVGYWARFLNGSGEAPIDDVFFEIPGRPDLVIRVANGVLDSELFQQILDTIAWDPSGVIIQTDETVTSDPSPEVETEIPTGDPLPPVDTGQEGAVGP